MLTNMKKQIKNQEKVLNRSMKEEKENSGIKYKNSLKVYRNVKFQSFQQQKTNGTIKVKHSPIPSQQSAKSEKKVFPMLNLGKKNMIHKALLQYSKNIVPIYQDKQYYQQQLLKLKQKNNQSINEIMRLRTRLAVSQKQVQKLSRIIEQDNQLKKSSKSGTDQIITLKSLFKQNKKEIYQLKQENSKIKRSVKFTKINQLEHQIQILQQQTIRLKKLLEQSYTMNITTKIQHQDIISLQMKIGQLQENNSILKKSNTQLKQKVKKLQQMSKSINRSHENEKNLNRIINNLKQRVRQKQLQCETYKKDDGKKQEQKNIRTIKKICENCVKLRSEIAVLNEKNRKYQHNKKKVYTSKTIKQSNYIDHIKKPSQQQYNALKSFLIYRFKAHHLSIQNIEHYLFKKQTTKTNLSTMIQILVSQPFFLINNQYLQYLIMHLYYNQNKQKQILDENVEQQNSKLLTKFKQLIGEYEVIDIKKQQQMFIQIAQLVTNYCQHISTALQSKSNGQGTISKEELYKFFTQIQLQEQYIQFIITQIILQSGDLQHLNYFALFQIFYLPVQQPQTAGQTNKKTKYAIQSEVKQLDQEYQDSKSHYEADIIQIKQKNKTESKEIKQQSGEIQHNQYQQIYQLEQ